MNITDFTTAKGVSFEKYNAEIVKYPDRLEVGFGNYARVSETVTLVKNDYAQASVNILLPENYPFGSRKWSERWVTFDNYQQEPKYTVRVALMCMMSGHLAIVSNRGSGNDGFHLLALSNIIPPVGREFTLSLQVYFHHVHGLVVGYMDDKEVLYGSGANIEKDTVIGRCRIGIDGASGAVGQSATFRQMVSRYEKRL